MAENGLIDQSDGLKESMGKLYLNELLSDATLIINDKEFPVHKSVLAIRSEYFCMLFTNGMSESTKTHIRIEESNAFLFEKLLRYIYTGQITMADIAPAEAVEMLSFANKYLFIDLEQAISQYLKSILTVENFFLIYEAAQNFGMGAFKEECLKFADLNGSDILERDEVSQMDADSLHEILVRNSFGTPEVEIYHAVCTWIQANGQENAEKLLADIRLSLLPVSFLKGPVRESGLFLEGAISKAIATISGMSGTVIPYRGLTKPPNPKWLFKEKVSLKKRQRHARMFLKLHPAGVPVLLRKIPVDAGYEFTDETGMMLNKEMTGELLMRHLAQKEGLPPGCQVRVLVNDGINLLPTEGIGQVYEKYRDEDFHLYISYTSM